MPFDFKPNSMLPATVSHGISANSWNTTPRSRPGPFTAWPSTYTVPPLAWSSPALRLSRVDLPQPDGPMMQTNSPSLTENETLSNTRSVRVVFQPSLRWYFLTRFSTRSSPMMFACA